VTGLGAGQPGSGPGWFADPLGPPGTLRWWDGRAWTARTVPDGADGEAISWSPALRSLAEPEAAPAAEAPIVVAPRAARPLIDAPTDATPLAELAGRAAVVGHTVVEAPPISFHPITFRAVGVAPPTPGTALETDESAELHPLDVGLDELAPVEPVPREPVELHPPDLQQVEVADDPIGAIDPLRAAFGDDAAWVEESDRSSGRARRRLVPALVAAAVVALAAGAGAGIVDGDDRPTVEPAIAYTDASAGFALRYPDTWQVERETPGESVQFTIADPGASALHTNLVTVRVGAEPADGESDALPSLDELSNEVTERLREQYPGVELEEAARTQLADAPAFRLQLVDADEVPPIRIQQYAGRTTTGRPLTVNITVREPRTAPTPQQLRDFITSIAPA
jgi:hypothetical protein